MKIMSIILLECEQVSEELKEDKVEYKVGVKVENVVNRIGHQLFSVWC